MYTDEYEGNDWFKSLEASKRSVEGLTSILGDNNEDVDAMARESVYEGSPNLTLTENNNGSVNDNENEDVGENKSVEMNYDEVMLDNNENTTHLNHNKSYTYTTPMKQSAISAVAPWSVSSSALKSPPPMIPSSSSVYINDIIHGNNKEISVSTFMDKMQEITQLFLDFDAILKSYYNKTTGK